MPDDSQSKPISPISDLTALEFIAHYLYRTNSVFEWEFVTLGIVQAEHSEADLENQIRAFEQVVARDPTAEYFQHSIRSAQYNLEWVRFERSIYGDSFLHMAAAALAASIISIAHQGIRLGERRGNASIDRMVQSPYRLREFVELSRAHGAHFWEKVSDAKTERLEFQKRVLSYDQKAEGSNLNYSARLLEILGWRSYEDVENDLMNLFDPTGNWKNPPKGETIP